MVAFEKLMRTARRLNAKAGFDRRLPPLIFMTDETRTPHPEAVVARLPRGSAVIFRNYADPHRLDTGKRLRTICKSRGVTFLVAGSIRLAHVLRADGIHWPEYALRGGSPWRPRTDMIVTAAVHNEAALRRAERAGVDAVLISPVFPTASHPDRRGIGVLRFAALAGQTRVPAYALGGITPETASRLVAMKVVGIAAMGGLTGEN
jgi:thiamine-phosphate pyrophosphorylase